ncbi:MULTISPECIES: phage major tail protein, TP901-1 family [Streptococcus]|uniref:phage major tail protein, TP901-1 family n=1 Tax=Streptococcus TaxID=1301 RepID=UPI001EE830F6|nr:phage major tail protein, TP901-1 family [Streptococcus suis]MBS8025585.1 phage major tail protein, TP901-1 family [Streptococcus suis]MCL4921878.1 phage major tail protein, TP901-1 family [Streptococcus suis]
MPIEVINGKDFLSFFRLLKESAKVDADRIRFMTEMTLSMEKETDSQTTVDGIVNSIADGENTLDFSALAYRDTDPETIEMWKQMRQWFLDGETVEVWNVDINSGKKNEETQKTEYLVDYFRGTFTSFELTSPADGKVELSYSLAIDGKGLFDNKDTLTEKQEAAVKAAQYAYQTLAKVTSV